MTAEIIVLDDHRPHGADAFLCFACCYWWIGIFPIGFETPHCPNCDSDNTQAARALIEEMDAEARIIDHDDG